MMNEKLLTSSDNEMIFEHLYKSLVSYGFDRMKIYVRETKDSMLLKKLQLEETFRYELETYPEHTDLTTMVYATHFDNYETHFVGILMNSAFISAYTLFEATLNKICDFARKRYKLSIDVTDLNGNDIIGKGKKYLENVIGIDLKPIECHWKTLTDYRKIRNCIVHNSATVNQNNKYLNEYIRRNKHMKLINPLDKETTTFFISKNDFIFDFCSLAHDYLTYVLHELVKIKAIKNDLA